MVNTLNLEIHKMYQWTIANKLSISVSKTQLRYFSNHSPELTQGNDVVSIGNERLDIVRTCKYLGEILLIQVNF